MKTRGGEELMRRVENTLSQVFSAGSAAIQMGWFQDRYSERFANVEAGVLVNLRGTVLRSRGYL